MKVLLIVLVIVVIGVIVWVAARSRGGSSDALPAEDRRDAITADTADDTAIAPPPDDITPSAMGESPLPPDPEPEEPLGQADEAAIVDESAPPVEPDPDVEPLPEPDPVVEPDPPPMEPEPIIEPDTQPAEPEPVIEPDDPHPAEPEPVVEPDTAGVGAPGDNPLTENTDPPRAVIDAGEMPAVDLDPDAGWESEEDRTIHADPESGLYHTPDSPGYKIGSDGQVFDTEDEAQSAGFTRWDQPDSEG